MRTNFSEPIYNDFYPTGVMEIFLVDAWTSQVHTGFLEDAFLKRKPAQALKWFNSPNTI